jgi:transposase
LEGILYVLRFAVPWAELPRVEGWPSGQTCWRRFHEWQQAGVWQRLFERMGELLGEEGQTDWSRAIVDASLVDAKKGAAGSAARCAAMLAAVST